MTQQATRILPTTTAEHASTLIPRLERLPFLPFHFRLASILGIGTLLDGFDTLLIAIIAVTVLNTFHMSITYLGILISVGYVGQLMGSLILGYFGERIGRRTLFISALAFFGLLSIFAVFAWNFQSFLVIRLLQSLGLGAEVPIASMLFNEYLPGSHRGRTGMMHTSLYLVGYCTAPVLALITFHFLGPANGWRVLFAIGTIPLCVAAIAFFLLPESVHWLMGKQRMAEADHIVVHLEMDAQQAEALPISVNRQSCYPIDIKKARFCELFSRPYLRRTLVIWVQWFTASFIFLAYTNWLPTLYVTQGHLTQTQAFLLTLVFGLINLNILLVVASTWNRIGHKIYFVIGYITTSVGAALGFGVASLLHIPAWIVLATAGLLMATGCVINIIGASLYMRELYPTRMHSWAASTGRGVACIAGAVAPFIISSIIRTGLGIAGVFFLFLVIALLGLLVMLLGGIETRQKY